MSAHANEAANMHDNTTDSSSSGRRPEKSRLGATTATVYELLLQPWSSNIPRSLSRVPRLTLVIGSSAASCLLRLFHLSVRRQPKPRDRFVGSARRTEPQEATSRVLECMAKCLRCAWQLATSNTSSVTGGESMREWGICLALDFYYFSSAAEWKFLPP